MQKSSWACLHLPGMLPLARELIKNDTAVVIAANSLPSINDITAQELTAILLQAGQLDKLIGRSLQEGTLQVVESGNDLPVIDLSKVVMLACFSLPSEPNNCVPLKIGCTPNLQFLQVFHADELCCHCQICCPMLTFLIKYMRPSFSRQTRMQWNWKSVSSGVPRFGHSCQGCWLGGNGGNGKGHRDQPECRADMWQAQLRNDQASWGQKISKSLFWLPAASMCLLTPKVLALHASGIF